MAASSASDNDVVWTLSNSLFPATPQLCETQNTFGLDGKTWALAEVTLNTSGQRAIGQPPPAPEPPLIVTQHSSPPRRFVFLTTQCCHIVTQLRPVDILRQLLIDASGPDSTAVRAFFQVLFLYANLQVLRSIDCLFPFERFCVKIKLVLQLLFWRAPLRFRIPKWRTGLPVRSSSTVEKSKLPLFRLLHRQRPLTCLHLAWLLVSLIHLGTCNRLALV